MAIDLSFLTGSNLAKETPFEYCASECLFFKHRAQAPYEDTRRAPKRVAYPESPPYPEPPIQNFSMPGRPPWRYGTRLGDLKNKQSTHTGGGFQV